MLTEVLAEKHVPLLVFVHHKSQMNSPGSNTGLRVERPETNCLR